MRKTILGIALLASSVAGVFAGELAEVTMSDTATVGETELMLNGKEKGLIEGDAISKALLSVFFGPEPPTEDLKAGMLGA